MMDPDLIIIGGGLAGSEAAWQAAKRGINVLMYEMRPHRMTPAHHTGSLAELVCSNSLRSNSLENAVGLLKEEMRRLGSLIMSCADRHAVPAGSALAVDRESFSAEVTRVLTEHPLINIKREEIMDIPENIPTIIASGPLTSDTLAEKIGKLSGEDYLYFFDAAAPIVTAESLDYSKVFWASRYDKGDADYLNCPMTEEEYRRFWAALITAEVAPVKDIDREIYFEGCMPVEEMARRGEDTLLYGPLKPVGLKDPITGQEPFAVIQLRVDNKERTLFNLVGFQTHLKWGEQERVFRMIPGLANAEFVRFGVMHRNIFINSPKLLKPTLQFASRQDLFFAGQITGVEGYVESASMGLLAGINASRLIIGEEPIEFPPETVHGSLAAYITYTEKKNFQPMNATFGLLPAIQGRYKKKDKKRLLAERALKYLDDFISRL